MPHIRSLLQPVFEHPAFRAAISSISAGGPAITLAGLTPTAKALMSAGLAHALSRPVVVLTVDNDAADRLRDTASTFLAWLEGAASGPTVGYLRLIVHPTRAVRRTLKSPNGAPWPCGIWRAGGHAFFSFLSPRRSVVLEKARIIVPLPWN